MGRVRVRLKIADEFATVRAIIDRRASIARFGDGELKLCVGRNQILQQRCSAMATKLRRVLCSDNPNLLVGVPRPMGPNKDAWMRFLTQASFASLYDPVKRYYSAFITRPDSAPDIDCDAYWDLVKLIWADRDVVILQGNGSVFCSRPDFLGGAASVVTEHGPRRDAFYSYSTLIAMMARYPRDTLLLLSLGPTATILAGDLSGAGYQALDVGHMGMFYDGTHPKSGRYCG